MAERERGRDTIREIQRHWERFRERGRQIEIVDINEKGRWRARGKNYLRDYSMVEEMNEEEEEEVTVSHPLTHEEKRDSIIF